MSTGPSNSTSASANPPSGRKPRKLVLCFDGTADSYDDTVTNVVKLYSLLKKDQVEDQLCYYQVSALSYRSQRTYVFVAGNRNILSARFCYTNLSMDCENHG
jgi:uncharacterized protein (DUF2235 family)